MPNSFPYDTDSVSNFANQQFDALLNQAKEKTPSLEIGEVVHDAVEMFSKLSRQVGGKWTELDNWAHQNKLPPFTMDLVVMPPEQFPDNHPISPFHKIEMRHGMEILVHNKAPHDNDALQFLRINPASLSKEDRDSFIKQIQETRGGASEDALKFIKSLKEGENMDYWAPWKADNVGMRWGNSNLETMLTNTLNTSKITIEQTHPELNFDPGKAIGIHELLADRVTHSMSAGFVEWGQKISKKNVVQISTE